MERECIEYIERGRVRRGVRERWIRIGGRDRESVMDGEEKDNREGKRKKDMFNLVMSPRQTFPRKMSAASEKPVDKPSKENCVIQLAH